jgi:cytochrome P450
VLDADFYETLYDKSNLRVEKYTWFYSMLGNPQATFPTVRADVHKRRRAALNPFFSMNAISKLHPTIQSTVDKLSERMSQCAEKNETIPLFYAYRCLTVDIISDYAFAGKLGMMEREDWGESFYSAWRSLWEMSGLIRQLPFIMDAFEAMPRWVTAVSNPKALEVIDMISTTDAQTKIVLESSPEAIASKPYPTIIWGLANNPDLPPEEKTFKRLAVEANSILAAGFETTAGVLTLMTFLILDNPDVHDRLKAELKIAIPDETVVPNWQALERLPYLSAVVKESLRYARISLFPPPSEMGITDQSNHQTGSRRILTTASCIPRTAPIQRMGNPRKRTAILPASPPSPLRREENKTEQNYI